MRIVFFGSDHFAAVSLKEILHSSHQVVAAVTGPDTRQGRGLKLALSPIKDMALAQDIVCLQPDSLKSASIVDQLKEFQADIFVVVAYGRLLTQAVLNIPKLFCVNLHGSLLPQYRGAAPINWSIIHGDKQTGVTVQKMALELDAGDIIAQEKIPLSAQINAESLRSQMALIGAKLLKKTLDGIALGQYRCTPQDESQVTLAPRLTKQMGKIQWQGSATSIERLIRGLKPWPGTFTQCKGKGLKILEASQVQVQGVPGSVVSISKEGFVVACSQGGILVKQVQPEAAKVMSAYDFIQGSRLQINDLLSQ